MVSWIPKFGPLNSLSSEKEILDVQGFTLTGEGVLFHPTINLKRTKYLLPRKRGTRG